MGHYFLDTQYKLCYYFLDTQYMKWVTTSWTVSYTVCPGSSDPPEKILNIYASENEVYTIF